MRFAVLTSVLVAVACPAVARGDGIGLGIAHGQDTEQYGVQVQFDRQQPLRTWSSSELKLYGIVGVGEFHGRKNGIPQHTVRVLGATGVLRWQYERIGAVRPFADFGLGIGGLSETAINGNRDFGGKFEFNEIIQCGVRFGRNEQWEFNLRGQHFSNAGLNPPNDGMTFGGAGVTWYWN
ncbi:MAG: acyloxyacyl hydrolase [Proteobacteria bacterium]|nr:acyloxyacyl hydrolase [Pseudomonadota bacterium]